MGNRGDALQALGRLRHHLCCQLQHPPQPDALTLHDPSRTAGQLLHGATAVDEHTTGPPGDLAYDAQHSRGLVLDRGFRLARPRAQGAAHGPQGPLDGAQAIAEHGADRRPGSLYLLHGARHHAGGIREQPDIGGVLDRRLDHRGVHPQLLPTQDLVVPRLPQQELVQILQHLGAIFTCQLAQRRRVRDLPIQWDVAKAAPVQAVRHFAHEHIIPKPVAMPEVHQPQIGLYWNSRSADVRVEPLPVRFKEGSSANHASTIASSSLSVWAWSGRR
jgi:hypothetical protein